MEVTQATLIYMATTAALGLLLLLRALWSLRRSTDARLRAVGQRKRLDAVGTQSPVDDPTQLAKERAKKSIETHFTVTRRLVIPLILLTTVLAVLLPLLRQVPAALVSVFVTALAVLLGVAARPFIENAIGGLVLSSSKQVRIGDTVSIEDMYGTIEDITLTHTTLKVWDWRRYVIPNSHMLKAPFVNLSLCDSYQWAYVDFWVAYDTDVELIERLALEETKKCPHYASHEDPQMWVMDLDKSGYHCWIAAWADTPSDAWLLKSDIRVRLLKAFREHGIATHRHAHEVQGSVPETTPGRDSKGAAPQFV